MSGSKVVITADAAQGIREFERFRAEASGALQKVSDLGGKMKGVLAAVGVGLSINAFSGMIDSSIEAAAGMHDLSIQTGASVASLMAFKSVASTSETTIDGIGGAMNKLAKGMAVATEESAGIGQAIKAIGLDFNNLKSMSPDQQMLTVAKALDEFQDGAGKSAVAMTLFGKEGAKMLPFLGDLAAEADQVTAKLTAQQVEMKAVQAAMADDFSDNLTKIKKEGQSWKKDIAMGMLPALYELSGAFYDVTTGAGGIKGEIGTLSRDGAFANWTRAAITGVTYLADGLEYTGRVFKAVGSVIGATLSMTIQNVTGVASAMSLFVKGKFSESWEAIKGVARGTVEVGKSFASDMAGTFSAPTFGSKLRDRIDEIRQAGTAAKEAKKSLDFNGNADGSAAAAVNKEAEAYAGLIASIRAKSDENRLELTTDAAATEAQKLRIKIDQELASGKLKLSDAHLAVVRAALGELDATEELAKAQKAEKDGMAWMQQSAQARNASNASLQVEYDLYGKSADAREVAMVAIKAEADLEKFLQDERSKGIVIGDELEAQLRAEKDMRVEVEQATLAQTKALGYANQLAQENRRFAAESIFDEKARAAALLQIDVDMWQGRIQAAGEGTAAQKTLQGEFDTWYRNQMIKPRLDEEKRTWNAIEQTAHDTFISIENGAASARDRIKNAIKNGLFEWLYQQLAKPWVINLQASMTGDLSQASAGAGGGLDTGIGAAQGTPYMSALNTATGVYKAVTGGFATLSTSVADAVQAALYKTGLSSNIASNGAVATAAGKLAGMAGSYMLGSSLNSMISGQYQVGSGFQTVEKIGTAIASYFGPIPGAIAGAVSGVLNRAFGMGDKNVTSQGLRGTVTASSLTGSSYAEWHQDGGWFRSDKNGIDTLAFTDTRVQQFTQGLAAIESASAAFASAMGVQADWLKDFSKTFDIKTTGDEAKDAQAIADFFTGVGDEIAQKLVPSLEKFTKSGESASATLQRLAGDFQATDQVAQLLGVSAEKLFGSAGPQSAGAREQLIDAAGGLSTLSQQASAFNQAFLTDAERLEPVAAALDKQLASLGLQSIPTSRDEFKALVGELRDSGAAATESGAKQLASLLAVAEAFALVHPAAEAAADGATKAANALQDVKDAAGALLGGVDSAYSVLQRVVDREKTAVQSSVDVHSEAAARLQGLSQALRGSLDAMKTPDQQVMERAAAQAQIRTALAIARAGGPLPSADSLKDAIGAVSQDASSRFGSYIDYLRDLYQTQGDMRQLADLTDDALTVEERALKAAQDQLKSLDSLVASAQAQIDLLKGIDANGLTVAQAMAALTGAIVSAKSNPIVAATEAINGAYQSALGRAPDADGLAYWQNVAASGTPVSQIVSGITGSTESELNRLYQSVLGRAPDAEGLMFWMQAYGPTMDEAEKADWTSAAQSELGGRRIPGFASGGGFQGGLRIVGENGPELEVTGPARIWSYDQTAALLSRTGSGDSAALVAEIKALREEVKGLRAEARATAGHTEKSARLLTRVIREDKLITATEDE